MNKKNQIRRASLEIDMILGDPSQNIQYPKIVIMMWYNAIITKNTGTNLFIKLVEKR
ncbi:MAG: hypothetical protein M0P94_01580 [Candidatus Absconditabacterales bacterium]|nr:hypothetical protein [Candidatus Absconditabacterales bacterium]